MATGRVAGVRSLQKSEKRSRPMRTTRKTLIAAVTALATLGVAAPAQASVGSQIQRAYQKQLRHHGFPRAWVKSVRCVRTGAHSAQCLATIRHPSATAIINVKIGYD